ncbi:MAG: hypothetical protein MIO93_06305 [ANME-2 cluster archaeon]|nr:hypothetical protein [ANME-2 cluster archaeon]
MHLYDTSDIWSVVVGAYQSHPPKKSSSGAEQIRTAPHESAPGVDRGKCPQRRGMLPGMFACRRAPRGWLVRGRGFEWG